MKKKVFSALSIILIIVMTSLLFVACSSDDGDTFDFDTLKSVFEENGYMVDEEVVSNGIITRILWAEEKVGEGEYDYEGCSVTWYVSAECAKEIYDQLYQEWLESGEEGCKIILRGSSIASGRIKDIELIESL